MARSACLYSFNCSCYRSITVYFNEPYMNGYGQRVDCCDLRHQGFGYTVYLDLEKQSVEAAFMQVMHGIEVLMNMTKECGWHDVEQL